MDRAEKKTRWGMLIALAIVVAMIAATTLLGGFHRDLTRLLTLG